MHSTSEFAMTVLSKCVCVLRFGGVGVWWGGVLFCCDVMCFDINHCPDRKQPGELELAFV